MEREEIKSKYLNCIYQNARTAIQSIEDLHDKCEEKDFLSEISKQQDTYSVLAKEAEAYAKAERIESIKDNTWLDKVKMWTSINMSTMMDKSTRHLAEMMLFGTFMGYITCIKDKCDHKGVSAELDELVDRLIKVQKDHIEKLIKFLDC